MTLLSIAQQILDGPWQHALRARAACRDDRWAHFVHETAPRAPLLLGRIDHAACEKRAASTFSGPRDVTLRLIPVWAGDTPDEEPDASWFAVHALQIDGGEIEILEPGHFLDDASPALARSITCKAKCWRVGNVVETKSYSPEIELVLRRGAYGVIANEVYEVESADEAAGEDIPRPQIVVPPFSCWFEPRVTGLAPEVVRMIRERSVTVDDEGNIIERRFGSL